MKTSRLFYWIGLILWTLSNLTNMPSRSSIELVLVIGVTSIISLLMGLYYKLDEKP